MHEITSVTRRWNIKKPKNFQKLPKKYSQQFVQKMDVFKRAKRVNTHLGYFCNKMFHQELSEIAQSSHTERNIPELSLRARTTASKHQSYGSAKYFDRGRGQVVSLLYLNSNNSSSSPAGVYIF